jgi:NADH:ubiquinone oxidoreductase subunit C
MFRQAFKMSLGEKKQMDKTQTALKEAEELMTVFDLENQRPEDFRLDIIVPSARLVEVVSHLVKARWGYLSAITGLDHPGEMIRETSGRQWRQQVQEEVTDRERVGMIEILYHFCNGAAVLTLRTWVSYTNPSVSSITHLIPSAGLYETELSEMFGVRLRNRHVAQDHLLLPDDWPRNVYPLRKSFRGLKETGKP